MFVCLFVCFFFARRGIKVGTNITMLQFILGDNSSLMGGIRVYIKSLNIKRVGGMNGVYLSHSNN